MKKFFELPELEVVEFSVLDVITTSADEEVNPDDPWSGGDF